MLYINEDIEICNNGSEGEYEIFARGFDDSSSVFMYTRNSGMATYMDYFDGPGDMISLIYVKKSYDENHNLVFTGECAYSTSKWIESGSKMRFTIDKDDIRMFTIEEA